MSTENGRPAADPSTETDARRAKQAERLARARSGPEGVRSALLEALGDEDDLPVGPILRAANLFPEVPPPPEAAVMAQARKIFEEQDRRSAPIGLGERIQRWWAEVSKPWALGAAGLAAAVLIALVVLPRQPKIGPESFAEAMAEAEPASRRVVLTWALALAAEREPKERAVLLADASHVLENLGAVRGATEPMSAELSERLAALTAGANAPAWRPSAQAAIASAEAPSLDEEASSDAVSGLGALLRSASPESRSTVLALADRWFARLSGSSRARFSFDVGAYLQRSGDADGARTWYERALDANPTVEVRDAAERRLREL